MLETEQPDRYTTNPLKAKRKGRIFVDYLRNGFGATAVAAYSTRARPGAPVATPIRWDELSPRLSPAKYDVKNVMRRLQGLKQTPGRDTTEQQVRPEILDSLQNG